MYFNDDDVTGSGGGAVLDGDHDENMPTMLFATVCEVFETFLSNCARVPPTITNLWKKYQLVICPAN